MHKHKYEWNINKAVPSIVNQISGNRRKTGIRSKWNRYSSNISIMQESKMKDYKLSSEYNMQINRYINVLD